MVSGTAKVAGVIGWPVAHSLSPRLHGYWLEEYRIDGAYIPMPVRPDDLQAVMRALPKMGLRGCNLTLPHKELVVPFLDHPDEDVKAIGAANTIYIGQDGSLHGMNTDVYGFMRNIEPHLAGRRGKAVVLGAGGAARGVCYGLIKEGFGEIILINRTQARAEALREYFPGRLLVRPWKDRSSVLEGCDLLVNATSLGMAGHDPLDIALDALPKDSAVADIIYTPLHTPLLVAAKDRGNIVIDGLGMLIHQAIPGFKHWFGMTPEVTPGLRDYLLKAVPKA